MTLQKAVGYASSIAAVLVAAHAGEYPVVASALAMFALILAADVVHAASASATAAFVVVAGRGFDMLGGVADRAIKVWSRERLRVHDRGSGDHEQVRNKERLDGPVQLQTRDAARKRRRGGRHRSRRKG